MRFGVVTVTYNNIQGLRKTSESVLAQSFEDFEWIVVDGGSTDGTMEFLSNLDQSRVRFLSEKDDGIYDAMNKGIDRTRADYCIFMKCGR